MLQQYLTVLVFLVVGVGFAVVSLLISRLLRRDNPSAEKLSTYECGEEPVGEAWSRFRVGFYIFCLIFVIFEVEMVFMFPAFMRLEWFAANGMGVIALLEILLFVSILLLGLVYAWKKGVLKWE